MPAGSAYRLDQLGWLQFERLCSLVLGGERSGLVWTGHADGVRAARLTEAAALGGGEHVAAPALVAVVWVPRQPGGPAERLIDLARRVGVLLAERAEDPRGRLVVLTNLDGERARHTLVALGVAGPRRLRVLGADELGRAIDGDPRVRAALPSVLGLRELDGLIDARVLERSTLDLEGAQALARVFSPTRAFEQAHAVLTRHGFVVLTGPPEMGKTAIARMIALARLTEGWEAHECDRPEQIWRALDSSRPQIFVADDAFGSTEYRADAAEHWARELGALLGVLDARHQLIWTSRPAPLKAGLRRVHRERGSERFPAPGEVLVDASDLSLEEKTLILFRHAKERDVAHAASHVLRETALTIVEHPHFTPERIRRFVAQRLASLPELDGGERGELLELLERELASPTVAMRASFRALEREHRDLLIALLDAPAGLIDERELAASVRRHHPGGLSRAPGVLIDRLTDHFVRVTSLGVGWVHPSWRDVVIDELRSHDEERLRFLRSCGIHGAMLALSLEGGPSGTRSLPLLISDGDWDALGDRLSALLRELDEHDVARLLIALRRALGARRSDDAMLEARSLARYALDATRRHWDARRPPLALTTLEAWHALNERLAGDATAPPQIEPTWSALYPDPELARRDRAELARADEWLALVLLLARYDGRALERLAYPEHDAGTLRALLAIAGELARGHDEDARELARSVLARIIESAPEHARAVPVRWIAAGDPDASRWWVPEDIAAPPSTEPADAAVDGFTRADVARVLSDL